MWPQQRSMWPRSVQEYMMDGRNTDSWFITFVKSILDDYRVLVSLHGLPGPQPAAINGQTSGCTGFACQRQRYVRASLDSTKVKDQLFGT